MFQKVTLFKYTISRLKKRFLNYIYTFITQFRLPLIYLTDMIP